MTKMGVSLLMCVRASTSAAPREEPSRHEAQPLSPGSWRGRKLGSPLPGLGGVRRPAEAAKNKQKEFRRRPRGLAAALASGGGAAEPAICR